jgi:hypothetical protein
MKQMKKQMTREEALLLDLGEKANKDYCRVSSSSSLGRFVEEFEV